MYTFNYRDDLNDGAISRRWLKLTAIGALFFAGNGGKVNPVGPFISIVFDVIPVTVAGIILIAALRCLRDESIYQRVSAFVPMVPALLTIQFVVTNVLSFWTRRHARGDLIGF